MDIDALDSMAGRLRTAGLARLAELVSLSASRLLELMSNPPTPCFCHASASLREVARKVIFMGAASCSRRVNAIGSKLAASTLVSNPFNALVYFAACALPCRRAASPAAAALNRAKSRLVMPPPLSQPRFHAPL